MKKLTKKQMYAVVGGDNAKKVAKFKPGTGVEDKSKKKK